MDIREVKEKRNTVVNEMRTILATAEQEKRDLSEAESQKFEELKSEEKRLAPQEERASLPGRPGAAAHDRQPDQCRRFETACPRVLHCPCHQQRADQWRGRLRPGAGSLARDGPTDGEAARKGFGCRMRCSGKSGRWSPPPAAGRT